MMPRVFVPFDKIKGTTAVIEGSDVNYLKNVMRLNVGDEIVVMDSKSKEYTSKILSVNGDMITAELVEERHPKSEPKVQITIAQGIPKGPKMELVVQKATELGAIRIIPVMMERSIPKFDKDKEQAKVNRWQKIAKEAAEQSGRLIIPFVDPVKPFKDLFLLKKDIDLCVLLWEMEKENMIKKVLQEHRGIKHLLVVIGPEGGFSHEEVESAKAAGFITASLGSRIVRTETASIAVLSILEYEFEM